MALLDAKNKSKFALQGTVAEAPKEMPPILESQHNTTNND